MDNPPAISPLSTSLPVEAESLLNSESESFTPEVITDAQLTRSRRKRQLRVRPLIRLVKKIEKKMHN